MEIFNGKAEAEKLDFKIAGKIKQLDKPITLLIIQIGNNLTSEKYINLKIKYCEKMGVNTVYKKINPSLGDDQIFGIVKNLFFDEKITGGIIQLPLPRESLQSVLNLIPYNKDPDMLSDTRKNQFYDKRYDFLPPVVLALNHFLLLTTINTPGSTVAVLGCGELVGRPVSFYLASQGAKVTILDEGNLYQKGRKITANLVVSAIGKPNILDPADLDRNTDVVDFGSSVVDGVTIGDLDIRSGIGHLGNVSLSPGGMGPLVIRYLIGNLVGL